MNNSIDDIVNDLSEEEKLIIEKIQEKLFEHFEKQQKHKREQLETISEGPIDFSEKHPDIIHSKNITTAPNELIFTIKAEASAVNSKGELESVVDIVEKFYHIPLKQKEEYKQYMDNFFDKFHNTLEETCKIINLDNKHEK